VWTTLRHRTFRAIWLAGLVSMIGSWMQGLGAAWLMTELAPSPLMVGLVQTAQLLPFMLLALPAGALIDMFDRRRYLIVVMTWQIVFTLILAALTHFNLVDPWLLLFLVFVVGLGGAAQVPATSAIIQDLVPREEVIGAVTLNSLSVNLSRSIGPAVAGLLVAASSIASAFVVNALTYVVYLVTLILRIPVKDVAWSGGNQGLWATISSGLRYARKAKRFRAVLIRGFFYFLFASANISLLPLMARHELGHGAEIFGTLLGFMGLGAIFTALTLTATLNARFSRDNIVLCASLILATMLLGLGWIRNYPAFAVTLVIFGGAWMTSMVALQVSAQMVLPGWVRGRGLSMSMMAFMAGMAAGGVVWGQVAEMTSLTNTFTIAAVGLALTAILTYRFKISSNETEEV